MTLQACAGLVERGDPDRFAATLALAGGVLSTKGLITVLSVQITTSVPLTRVVVRSWLSVARKSAGLETRAPASDERLTRDALVVAIRTTP